MGNRPDGLIRKVEKRRRIEFSRKEVRLQSSLKVLL
jgi:hypothetical protein